MAHRSAARCGVSGWRARGRLRRVGAALLSVGAIGALGTRAVAANLSYSVNQKIGAGSVVGQIVTDGKAGALSQTDIVSWSLTLNAPGASTVLTSTGANSVVMLVGGDVTATARTLSFNYGAGDQGRFFFQATNPGLYSGAKYYCNNTNWSGCAAGASVVPQTYTDASAQFDGSYTGLQVIGTAGATSTAVSSSALAFAPLVGSPQSLQFGFIDQALSPETLGRVDFDQPANLVGVQYGRIGVSGADGDRVDASYRRSFRIFPGSRTLLVVDAPLTFYDSRGGQEFRGTGAVGLQVPVTRDWTVQPQVAYGVLSAHSEGVSGQSVAASLSSQYALYNRWLGRGRLTIGNMVGYTQVTDVRLSGLPVSRHPGNFVTRDGLAYEYPLKTQFDGRAESLRASYTYTYVDGRGLSLNQTHDLTVSLGVRTRETTLKNSYELIRVGLRGELGDKYNAVYLFGGYRF